jgi:type IV secretion system protein TrbL
MRRRIMTDLSVIDKFTETFSRYIDSGFGLLGGEATFLSSTLIAIDITLAGLVWSLDGHDNVVPALVRKVLYIGAFAFIIGNFKSLADIIFASFTSIGLKASGGGLSAGDLMRPGFVAAAGFTAAHPLLEEAGQFSGFEVLTNIPIIVILLFCWIFVILAFFLLSVQLFVTLIEFKLTSLAGFVLVPFALWGKTAFVAERTLGNVVASGVKVMVLTIVVGIGSTIFGELSTALTRPIDVASSMSLLLAALSLLGLGIFCPGIAAGLVAGAPQLGAGAAATTVVGAGSVAYGAGALAIGSLGASAGVSVRTARSAASLVGRISDRGRRSTHEVAGDGSGITRRSLQVPDEGTSADHLPKPDGDVPGWVAKLRRRYRLRDTAHTIAQTLKEGDKGAQSSGPKLGEDR